MVQSGLNREPPRICHANCEGYICQCGNEERDERAPSHRVRVFSPPSGVFGERPAPKFTAMVEQSNNLRREEDSQSSWSENSCCGQPIFREPRSVEVLTAAKSNASDHRRANPVTIFTAGALLLELTFHVLRLLGQALLPIENWSWRGRFSLSLSRRVRGHAKEISFRVDLFFSTHSIKNF